MEHSGFPSHETLAAFVDGRLDAETRRRVLDHMAGCDECRGLFVTASGFRAAEGLNRASGNGAARRRVGLLAAAIGIAVVGFVLCLQLTPGARSTPLPTGVEPLIEASASLTSRGTEARISGFPYRPMVRTLRGPQEAKPEDWKVYKAASAIEERARDRSPEHLHALGISQLVLGRYPEAKAALEQAILEETGRSDVGEAIRDSKDAPLLSDLSAAFYAFAVHKARPVYFLSAVDAAESAWQLDPRSPEIAWNRAIAIQRLSLHKRAAAAWRAYFDLDRDRAWRTEAEQHARAIAGATQSQEWEKRSKKLVEDSPQAAEVAAQLTRDFPLEARHLAQKELREWGEAVLAGNQAQAEQKLAVARSIALTIAARGDTLLSGTVAAVDRSSDRGRLARGFVACDAGSLHFGHDEILAAAEQYSACSQDLAGTPFRPAAEYFLAKCDFNRNDYNGTLRRLDAISVADLTASHWLRGKVLWLRGLTETILGRPREAFASYDRSRDAFRAVGEVANELAVENLVAVNEEYVGSDAAAWQRRVNLLEQLARLGDSDRKSLILSEIARAAARQGHAGTARIMAEEMVSAANQTGRAVLMSDAHLNRGLVLHLAGDDDGARHELQVAELWMGRIPDSGMRERISANIELTAFDWRVEPASVSIGRLTEAIGFYEKTSKQFDLAQIRFRRARLLCANGSIEPCREDLEAGIATASSELRDLADPVLFGTYLDTMRGATDAMASLLVQRSDVLAALPYVDCSRLLLSTGQDRAGQCAPDAQALVAAIQQRLPADAALLEFDALDGQLMSWIVTRYGTRAVIRPMPRSMEASLLAPFDSELRGVSTLVVVPDQTLDDISMPALRNPVTGRNVIEDMRVVVSPSAATFAASRPPGPPRGRALIVCNAQTDSANASGLPALPNAEAEAKEIEAQYASSALLDGPQATSRRFLQMAEDSAIVHFVGHAVPSADAPLFAALALAPDGQHDSGMLFARDIARASFPRTAVVVLSACDTARPGREEGGVTNIARAFLAAGVPAVIASTSPVDDAAAREMFRRVHLKLAQGVPPADALRATQIELIRSGAPPAAWAGFQYLGSI